MRARQVFEFHKGNDALDSLGIGINPMEEELNSVATRYGLKDWKSYDNEFAALFMHLVREHMHLLLAYMLKKYFKRLNSIHVHDIHYKHHIPDYYWLKIATNMIIGKDKDEYVTWAIKRACDEEENPDDLTHHEKNLLINYLLNNHFLSKSTVVNEFHKGNDPIFSLGLGIESNIDRYAKLLQLENWREDDYDLCKLLFDFSSFVKNAIPEKNDLISMITYLMNKEKYINRLKNPDINKSKGIPLFWISSCYWFDVASNFIEANIENKMINVALETAKKNKERLEDMTNTNTRKIASYLLKNLKDYIS